MSREKEFRQNITYYLLTYPQIWLKNNLDFLNKNCIDWESLLLLQQRAEFELEIDLEEKEKAYISAGIYGLSYGFDLVDTTMEVSVDNIKYTPPLGFSYLLNKKVSRTTGPDIFVGSKCNNSSIICTVDTDVLGMFTEIKNISTLMDYKVWFRLDNRSGEKRVNFFTADSCIGLADNCEGLDINALILETGDSNIAILDRLDELHCNYLSVTVNVYLSHSNSLEVVEMYKRLQKVTCPVQFSMIVSEAYIPMLVENFKQNITKITRKFNLMLFCSRYHSNSANTFNLDFGDKRFLSNYFDIF